MSSDTFDELRILAGELRCSGADRALINRAADELEAALKMIIVSNNELIAAQHQLIAKNERILELSKNPKMLMEPFSMGWSGLIKPNSP
jgi:hypothetical protein